MPRHPGRVNAASIASTKTASHAGTRLTVATVPRHPGQSHLRAHCPSPSPKLGEGGVGVVLSSEKRVELNRRRPHPNPPPPRGRGPQRARRTPHTIALWDLSALRYRPV